MGEPISDKTSKVLETMVGGFSGGIAFCVIAGAVFAIVPDLFIGDPDDGGALLLRLLAIFGGAFVVGCIVGAWAMRTLPEKWAKKSRKR